MFPDHIDWSDRADITHWLDYLRQKLNGRHSRIDEQLQEAALADTLEHYRQHPECFDASRGSLFCYLWWRVRHYLDKQLQKEQCHRKHERAAGVSDRIFEKIVSEVRLRGGIYIGRDRSGQEVEEREEKAQRQREIFNTIVADLNPHDRADVELLRTGILLQSKQELAFVRVSGNTLAEEYP